MIIYKDPITSYMCRCSLDSSVPDGITYKEVPSHERDEFNEAITDYDVDGAPVVDLVKAKTIKVKEASVKAEEALKVITSLYSEGEMKTWGIQEAEAKAYLLDSTTPVPFLDGLSAGTGISVLDLANKIILKADTFKGVSAVNIAKRQVMEANANAAVDLLSLKGIIF